MKKLHLLGVLVLGIIVSIAARQAFPLDIAAFFGFLVVIAGIIYLDRKSVKLQSVVLMRRTKKGRDFIDRVAQKSPAGWRIAGNVGIVLGIIVMVIGALFLVTESYAITTGAKEGGVKLLLPGPVSAPVNAPGVFVVPWWIWVIGIAVVIIPHEFMHGIMCRIDKVRIKSVGWILLFVIPGAFVEPDEKQLAKQSKATKLRVYAAGSFANLVTAFIIVLISAVFLSPLLAPAGVYATTVENGPAFNASLNGSITEINGQKVMNREDVSLILSQYNPGETVIVKTAETKFVVPMFNSLNILAPSPTAVIDAAKSHTYTVKLGENPDTGKSYIGIYVLAQAATLNADPGLFINISTLLLWMFVFSFGIGIVNMLPIGPLDGGQFFGELSGNRKRVTKIVSAVFLALLLFNIIGPLFLGG